MTDLPWNAFLALAGDPPKNWEVLCREVIRRHYERFGPLRTRKQQPGVEFHLPLQRHGSDLGDPPAHWGWQCRWYAPDAFQSSGRLRVQQRKDVEEAIAKTRTHVDDLTDWVLWTRDKLNADDARWFAALDAPFALHAWDEETLVGMLSGEAQILRETWFGDLVLTEERLRQLREQALAPIHTRYIEQLHVRTTSQLRIDRFIPNAALANTLRRMSDHLVECHAEALRDRQSGLAEIALFEQIELLLRAMLIGLRQLGEVLANGQLPTPTHIRQVLRDSGHGNGQQADIVREGPRRTSDAIIEAASSLAAAQRALEELADGLSTSLLAIAGGAGAGKTHLAANLTGPDEAPHGILILGRQFGAELRDDELPVAAGLAGRTRDELLEALEATGAREGRRIALVIDGLNESEDPRGWSTLLARLTARLVRLPHVLAVVTVRPSYAAFALPDGAARIDLTGFAGVEDEAVARYFAYYRIRADLGVLHWWPPAQPLLLSIFCRTVNPAREREVYTIDLPTSLTQVFEAYLADVHGRIATRMQTDVQTITDAVSELAYRFFTAGARSLATTEARIALGDDQRAEWKQSLRFQLESEELLNRDVVDEAEHVLWSYDLLGGHLIAKAILSRCDRPTDLRSPKLLDALEWHPLHEDVVAGLSGILGERGVELTPLLLGRPMLQASAALLGPRLPAAVAAEASVHALEQVFAERPDEALDALDATAFVPGHALNATVLDRFLEHLPVWHRDLTWTEWVRGRTESVRSQLRRVKGAATQGEEIDRAATLTWLSWLLTTTDKRLHDEVTHTLYILGRASPEHLFDRAIRMLDCNDRSVTAGLLAAAYGVAMTAQDPASETLDVVLAFANRLDEQLLGEHAASPTSHWLIREYAYRVTQLASWLSDGKFHAPSDAAQPVLPNTADFVERFAPDGDDWQAMDGAFRMDFANYTIGRLIEDRGNYDNDHPRFQEVSGEIRQRVAQLGWTQERFGTIDEGIARRDYDRTLDPAKVERYGKKYSWAGFYEAAGRLCDTGELKPSGDDGWRLSDVPVDPSFPVPAPPPPFELPSWVDDSTDDDENWIRHGTIEIPDQLLRPTALGDDDGPWIAVDGFLCHRPADVDRKVFGFIRGIVALDGWPAVTAYLEQHPIDNRTVPLNGEDYYRFAGEAPWSPTFDALHTDSDGNFAAAVERLGDSDEGPRIELLAVGYAWESYHSALNAAGGISMPTKAFSRNAGLRMLASGAELVDARRRSVVKAFAMSGTWSGQLLYVRQHELERYCRARQATWGWIVWGERELLVEDAHDRPDWLTEVSRRRENRFHRAVSLLELAEAAP